jgi:hypothetical protein
MRYRLRTLMIILALGPAWLAREPLAILVAAVFATCVAAAKAVEAIDAVSRYRVQR